MINYFFKKKLLNTFDCSNKDRVGLSTQKR